LLAKARAGEREGCRHTTKAKPPVRVRVMVGSRVDLALCGENAQNRDCRITEGEADVDGTAARNSRICTEHAPRAFPSGTAVRNLPWPLQPGTPSRQARGQGACPAPAVICIGLEIVSQHHLSRWSGTWSASVNGVACRRVGSPTQRASRFDL